MSWRRRDVLRLGAAAVLARTVPRPHSHVVPAGGIAPVPFTLGTTQPDASNTGYGVLGYTHNAGSLAVGAASTDLTITTDGTVIEGQYIRGMVQVNANNCTIRGCHIVSYVNHAYPGSTHYGIVSTGGTGNVIEYNDIGLWDDNAGTDNSGYSGSPTPYWPVGVLLTGGSTTVRRNNIHDANDLVYITGGTHTVQGNYLHECMFRSDDADQSGSTPPSWSHNDGVQFMGGTNHLIQGNSFVMVFSALTGMPTVPNPSPLPVEQVWTNHHGILFSSSNNTLTGVTIDQNWFKYAACCCHFTTPTGGVGTVTLTGNRFTPDQSKEFSVYTQIRIDPAASWTVSVDATNVYSADPDTPSGARGATITGPAGTTVKVWQYNASAHTP